MSSTEGRTRAELARPTKGPERFRESFERASIRHGVPIDLLTRVAEIESGFNPRAQSKRGAIGIMQIVPKWHPDVDPWDPDASIDHAAQYLRENYERFGNRWDLALAAYHAGPSAVMRAGGIPKTDDGLTTTQSYVEKIINHVDGLGGLKEDPNVIPRANARVNPNNPFSGIVPYAVSDTPLRPPTSEDNPFKGLIFGAGVGQIERDPIIPAAGRLLYGVGRGALYPVRAFRDTDDEVDEGLAGSIGEFLGMGIAIAATAKGAGAALIGTGLVKRGVALGASTKFLSPLGMTPAGVRGAHVAKWSLGFAGFETFAGESVEEAPFRFARGLAEGAAFELALVKVADRWRKHQRAKGAWKPSGPDTYTLEPVAQPDVSVMPLALKLENAMRPNMADSPEAVMAKLRAMGDPQKQLHETVVDFLENHTKAGHVILSQLSSDEVKQLTKTTQKLGEHVVAGGRSDSTRKKLEALYGTRVLRDVEVVPRRRIKDADVFDVWVIDTRRDLWKVKDNLKLSVDEVLAVTKARFDELEFAFPDSLSGGALGQYNMAVPPKGLPGISVKRGELTHIDEGISILFHEIFHHITRRVGDRVHPSRMPKMSSGKVDATDPPLDELLKYAQRRADGRFAEGLQHVGLTDFEKQLHDATLKRLELSYRLDGHIPQEAKKHAKNAFNSDPYYREPSELISRMGELIYIAPKEALRIAPDAAKLVGNLLYRDAPTIHNLLSKSGRIMVDFTNTRWRKLSETQRGYSIFERGRVRPTLEQKMEWVETGWAKGMRALVNSSGREVEYLRRVSKNVGESTPSRVLVRDLSTGHEEVMDLKQLSRPFLQQLVIRDEQILKAIDGVLDTRPTEIPFNLRFTTGTVERALLNVEDFLTLDGSISAWVRNLPHGVQEQLINEFGRLAPTELRTLQRLGVQGAEEEYRFLVRALELTGHKGVVQNDNGFLHVMPRDPATVVTSTGVSESPAFGAHVAGEIGDLVYTPSVEDLIKHELRKAGVAEVDMDFFYDIAERRFGERLRRLKSDDVVTVENNVTNAVAKQNAKNAAEGQLELPLAVNDGNYSSLTRAGLKSDRLPDGRYEIRDMESHTVVARVSDENALLDYAREVGPDEGAPVLARLPGVASHGGGAPPPKANAPMFPAGPPPPAPGASPATQRKWYQNLESILFGKHFTALENEAKKIENLGLGPAYSKIYVPAHNAMLAVQREISNIGRDAFGGLTFKDKIQELSNALVGISAKRHSTITGHIEALTREEIERAGGLMTRAMTENEKRVAQMIDALGLGQDVPRLMTTGRLVESVLKGNTEKVIERIRRIEITPETQELLNVFEAMPKFKNKDEVLNFLGLTDGEKKVLKLIEDSHKQPKDKFSINAVSRWASAPHLKKGFKNGQEQFAFENKMTKQELEASRLASEITQAAFKDSGLDSKRFLSGYWPHLRKWAQEGVVLDSSILPDDAMAWVATRYRSGELNLYETNPVLGVYRHIRGLYMNRHFDPIMGDVNDAIRAIEKVDTRAAATMQEYIMELAGRPHASFQNLQHALKTTMKAVLGKEPPEDLVNNTVSTLAALTSAAMLPFRPALIARNFYESFLKVAPRTGVNEYFQGLNYVVSASTRKEAFRMAQEAGAIRPGTTKLRSIHAADELFGPKAPALLDRYLRIFDKGFEWYQSADDWGRAIAYHAQRIRVQKNLGDYVKKKISLEDFKDRAKINTFDPLDIKIAEEFILDGNYDRAINHLGQVLSRETMTRYGYADHPAGWHSVAGRLFGQFGTWPVQYKDYLIQGITRGSTKDRVEFAAIHSAITGGTILGGAAVGVNLQNWTGVQFYAGGPYADLMVDVTRSLTGSDAEKTLARMSLYGQIPILGWMETGNPRSMFLPGSFLLGDLDTARQYFERGDGLEAMLSSTGLRVMRPGDPKPLEAVWSKF